MVLENLVNTGSGNGLALRHQAITWTNVDLSSARCSGIHLSAILQEIPQPSVTEISSKITYLKLCSNLPGANELIEPVMAKRNDAYIRHKASAICLKYYSQNTHRMGCCIFNQWMRRQTIEMEVSNVDFQLKSKRWHVLFISQWVDGSGVRSPNRCIAMAEIK